MDDRRQNSNGKLIEADRLTKIFPIKGTRHKLTAVNGVSFGINEGETFGLIGESGSGKSTVGRCLLNLIPPSSGSIRFEGMEYAGLPEKKIVALRTRMQMVFQDPYYSLNPRRTIWQTVEGAINVSGRLSAAERREMVRTALAEVCIGAEDYEKYPHQLSMGHQQRVGVARAIASRPKFIVLDEPTSSLDITVRGEIIDLLGKLQQDLGITYLFISHDLSTIQYICHQVAVMYLGLVVEMGSKDQVFHSHRHPYSKALLASVMHPDPERHRAAYKLFGEIPSPINLPRYCFLASRCPEARERCTSEPPPMVEVEQGHRVRCHFV